MRICVPTEEANGWTSRVAHHFGRAPHYALIDTQNDALVFVSIRGRHQGGKKPPAVVLLELKPEVVICSGMGPRAIDILRQGGVQVYAGALETLRGTIDQFQAGALDEANDDTACKESRHGR